MVESSGSASSTQPTAELEPIAELTALARVLQQGRQARGLGQAELAQRLNMGLEQLIALEQADRSRLPEPVFVIAQARRIAAALDLDAAEPIEALRACSAFQRPSQGFNSDLFNNKALQAPPPSAARSGTLSVKANARSFSGAAPLLWGVPVMVVLAAAGWGLWSQRSQLASLLSSSAKRPQPSSSLAAKPASHAAPAKPAPVQPTAVPVATALIVQAKTTSWLEVKSLNGQQKLFRGMFKGEKRFPLARGILLLAGRPDIVRVTTGSAPAKPLGTVKDIRWFQFKPGSGQPLRVMSAAPKPRPAPPRR